MTNKSSLTRNELLFCKKLMQKKYRQENKLFLIEGKHLIEEAFKKGNIIKYIITSDDNFNFKNVEIKTTSYKNICSLSTTKNPQEYIALCRFIDKKEIDSKIVLILNNINDPGNLGTLIRTSAAFGIKDVIVEGVDIYNSKTIRSTQGALFNINVFNTVKLIDELLLLKKKKYKLVGATLEGAKDYNKVDFKNEKIALILGNEANGIEEDVLKILDYKIYIPIKFESLNVAVAGGILISKYCK